MTVARSAIGLAALALVAAAPAATDPRVRLVEERLPPAVVLKGTPPQTKTLAAEMKRLAVPGVSVAVIDHGKIAWVKGYGVESAGAAAITPTTRFQAGSISKSVTALGVLRMAAAGTVSLDRPVNNYLTSWKLPDSDKGQASAVTLRRLLSHTAGLNVRAFPGYAIGAPQPGVVDILDGRPPANTPAIRIIVTPGSAWNYSGGGYVVAQQAMADVSRQPFAVWARRAILVPAGMTSSSFFAPTRESHALGHEADGTAVPGGYHLYPEAAAAGLWTTPTDLARSLLALSASIAGKPGAILPQSVASVVLDPVFPGETVGFDTGGTGLGQWIAKGGDTEGFASYLVLYPGRGQGVVVMTNGANGSTLAREVVSAVAKTYGWPDFGPRMRTSVAFDPARLGSLPGTYRYGANNSFTVARAGNGLSIADPGAAPETLYADPSGVLFTLSQDVAFAFAADGTGEIRVGHNVIPFRKDIR